MAIGDQYGAARDIETFRTAAVQLAERFDIAFRTGQGIARAYAGATAADFVAMGATEEQSVAYAAMIEMLATLPATPEFAALAGQLDRYRNILA